MKRYGDFSQVMKMLQMTEMCDLNYMEMMYI